MNTKKFKIIFMGTPDFAVPSLKTLCELGYKPSLVITQLDKPKGRGKILSPPAVKECSLENSCEIIQVKSVKTQEFKDVLKNIQPDILVVIAFGHVLPKDILDIPRFGAINIHASLLPKYRGAAPIQWAIINAETETGVTSMFINEGLDTGDIIISDKIKIDQEDNADTLYKKLSVLGSQVLIKTLNQIETNNLNLIKQDDSQASYAPILKKEDGHINWSKEARLISCFIRGMTPWPGAFCFLNNKRLKILSVNVLDIKANCEPATIVEASKNKLYVSTGDKDKVLSVLEIQPEGKKKLLIKDFLAGHKIEIGTKFS